MLEYDICKLKNKVSTLNNTVFLIGNGNREFGLKVAKTFQKTYECIVSQCKDFWENRPGMKSDRKVDSVVNSVHKRMIRRRTDRIRSIHAEHNRESQNQIVTWHRVDNSTPRAERTGRIQLQYDGMQIHQPNVRRRIESGPMTISELM